VDQSASTSMAEQRVHHVPCLKIVHVGSRVLCTQMMLLEPRGAKRMSWGVGWAAVYLAGSEEVPARGVDVEVDVLVGLRRSREPHHHAARVSDVPAQDVVLLPRAREEVVAIGRKHRLRHAQSFSIDECCAGGGEPCGYLCHPAPMSFEHRHHATLPFRVESHATRVRPCRYQTAVVWVEGQARHDSWATDRRRQSLGSIEPWKETGLGQAAGSRRRTLWTEVLGAEGAVTPPWRCRIEDTDRTAVACVDSMQQTSLVRLCLKKLGQGLALRGEGTRPHTVTYLSAVILKLTEMAAVISSTWS
jgi:hypothetical protein